MGSYEMPGQVLADTLRAPGDRQKAQADEAKKALRERRADELEQSIKNIQQRGALPQGAPGYISPEELKFQLGEAQKQLTGLYQPHEGEDLLKRLKGLHSKTPATPATGTPTPVGAATGTTVPVLRPGMTLNDVLAMGGPTPEQPKKGTPIGKAFKDGNQWSQIFQDDRGNLKKETLPGYSEQTRKQELVDQGYTEAEATKIMRIEGGLEAKAVATKKGFKYDAATDEVVDQDTQERFTRDDVSKGIGGETVARMFEGQKKVAAKKDADQLTKFNQSIDRQNHAFQLAIQRSDHAGAQRYVTSAKNDLVQAESRVTTMDQNQKDALAGNQQAMLSLVANHIGMTLGAQKGARITRAVWEEAIESAPWIEQKASKWFHTDENGDHIFDGYKGGVTLTPDQIKQMVGLAHQKVDTLRDQVQNMKKEMGAELGTKTGDTPPPAAPELTDQEKQIQKLLNGGPQ
jgi:hypothetical protein